MKNYHVYLCTKLQKSNICKNNNNNNNNNNKQTFITLKDKSMVARPGFASQSYSCLLLAAEVGTS